MTVSLSSSRPEQSRMPDATEGAPAGKDGVAARTAIGTPQIRPGTTPGPSSHSSSNFPSTTEVGPSSAGAVLAGGKGVVTQGHRSPRQASTTTSNGSAASGEFKFGKLKVGADELKQLGATVNGESFEWLMVSRGKTAVQDDLVNRIQFGDAQVESALKATDNKRTLEILSGVAIERSSSAPLVQRRTDVPATRVTVGDLVNQKMLPISGAEVGKKMGTNPVKMFLPGEALVQHTGVGVQIYGVMRNLADLGDALQKGETAAAVIAAGAAAGEVGSAGLEYSLPKLGTYLGRNDIPALNRFNNSKLGKRFGGTVTASAGAGKLLSRGASLAGVAVSLPWEVASAAQSFINAGKTTGRQRQDHYVEGGLAVTSALTTIGLTGAALGGVSAAGPIGVAVGASLAAGAQIYKSVREVEDLGKHTELTAFERLDAGWRGFVGHRQSQEVVDRAAVGAADQRYRTEMTNHMQGLLDKFGYKSAIFGDAEVKARPPEVLGTTRYPNGKSGMLTEHRLKQLPAAVSPNTADDNIDASGDDKINNVVTAAPKANPNARDAVLWNTGHGNDTLRGRTHVPNYFELASGRKTVTGGNADDVFNLTKLPGAGSSFDGGDGSDTLSLNPASSPSGTSSQWTPAQTRVILPADDHALGTLEHGDIELATLRSVENVSTQAGGRTRVIGNAKDNVFMMNGADVVKGGDGNDTYFIEGAGIKFIEPGAGANRYRVKPGTKSVIVDQPRGTDGQPSGGSARVELGYGVGQMNVLARGEDLVIETKGGERLILRGVREDDGNGGWRPAQPDGNLVIVTADKLAITPDLHHAAGTSRKVELLMENLSDFERRTSAPRADDLTVEEANEANAHDVEPPIPNLLASLPAAADRR